MSGHGRRGAAVRFAALLLAMTAGCGGEAEDKPPWQLAWSDEFDAPAGTLPDASKWTLATGGHGWGNGELQLYTDRPDNAAHDGQGLLVITARAEETPQNAFTSARLTSKDKFQQQYGRFEARLKLPAGRGLWPAFWLLGANVDSTGWPACGEIDVMEERGATPWRVTGAVHGPGHSGGNALIAAFDAPARKPLSDDFHLYAAEWEDDEIRFYVDGQLYHTVRATRMPPTARWVYDHPFFLLLNLAVGGYFGGPPDATTVFPQTMQADYVRVYQRAPG
jgi:beta-glucanase (GH16 family)